MAFDDNLEILQELFPDTAKKVIRIQNSLDPELVRVTKSKSKAPNLMMGTNHMHDNKNPRREARNVIDGQKNVEDNSDVIFYGIGLGYHIEAFAEQYPNTPFIIYEPVPEIFFQYLQHGDLRKLPRRLLRGIFLETDPDEMMQFCRRFVNNISKSVMVIELPSYKAVFAVKHKAFFTEFERLINERRVSVFTNSAFQKRWTINSIKNLMQVLSTPNILLQKQERFYNKPAILVAAGPSLDEELKNLKTIREKGLAYIFSAGTALNTLVRHNVFPHAACTYDPTRENEIFCKEVVEKRIKDIPLIFGSTVGFETIEKYPGPKAHMLINQDNVAAFYLKPRDREGLDFIQDATTIAVIVLQLLAKLGFNPIILVGQNLAYYGHKNYAAGSTYPVYEEINQQEFDNAVFIKDVHGNTVPSNDSYIRMKQQMELLLNHFRHIDVINCTRHGAHIEGTLFAHLSDLIEKHLRERVVPDDWFELHASNYDVEYLMRQSQIMSHAFSAVRALIDVCHKNLDRIGETTDSRDTLKISRSYEVFNEDMNRLRTNLFFASFLTPMTRVELESLILAVPAISDTTEPVIKAAMMEKEFRPYLNICTEDLNHISPLFEEMTQSIRQLYTVDKIRQQAARIKVLIIDDQRILTDEKVYYSSGGDEIRSFNDKDRLGILLLKERGIQTLLINRGGSPAVESAARKMGISEVCLNGAQVMTLIRQQKSLDRMEWGGIFFDNCDDALWQQAGLSFAVKNAAAEVQAESDYVLNLNGGQGVVLEIARLLGWDSIT